MKYVMPQLIPAPFELVRNLVDRPDERVGRIGSVTGRQARHLLAEFTDRRVCVVSDLDDLTGLRRVEGCSAGGASRDVGFCVVEGGFGRVRVGNTWLT